MISVAAKVSAAIFANPILAADATALPLAGGAFPVRVVPVAANRVHIAFDDTVMASDVTGLRVRQADWPSPASGDSVGVGDLHLVVVGAPQAAQHGQEWLLACRPAASFAAEP